MFRIYLRSGRTNLLRCPITLQHSRLRPIHCSSSYNLPVASKASEPTDGVDPPVKRTRRKTVKSEVDEEGNELPVKAKKTRARKSVTSEAAVEGEDGSAVEPVKRRSRKSVTTEDVEGEDGSPIEPVKRRSRKSVTTEDVAKDSSPIKSAGSRRNKFEATELIKAIDAFDEDSVTMEMEMERWRNMFPAVDDVEEESQDAITAPYSAADAAKRKRDWAKKAKEEELLKAELLKEDEEIELEYNGVKVKDFMQVPYSLRSYLSKTHKAGVKMGDRSRINIVNEGLCDDVLERLKPSLSKHIGCDIIDINPGLGFWSSRIHEFLKPRTHILMEPDSKKYLPYLQPLLDAKDSTYQHIPKSGTVWNHLGHVTTPEYLPHQKKLSFDDPKINESNDTLLVIANLGHYPRRKYRGFESISQLVMYQLLSAARSHALFHQYGLIRMLIWIPDVEKATWLVRHPAQMRKNAIEAQITTKHIREIASSTVDNNRFVRDAEAGIQNTMDVVRVMDKMGITTPKHRQGPMEIKVREALATGEYKVKSDDFQRFKRKWKEEWEDLDRREKEGLLVKYKGEDQTVKKAKTKRSFTPEFARYTFLKSKLKIVNEHGRLHDEIVSDYKKINQLHGELIKETPDLEDIEKSKNELQEMIEAYEGKISDLPIAAQKMVDIRLDGARIRLQYEKRDMEPIKVHAKEFRPPSELCLLDIEPQALWPILRENYPSNYDVFEYIIGTMYASPIDTVHESLESLWPGALEYIAPNCPSLTDPSKGGAWDLKHLTVRALTTDMLREICEAWMKWPFKPDRFELMVKSGSVVHDEDGEEDGWDGP